MSMIKERKELAERIEVTLKEYMEAKFDAMDKAVSLAVVDIDRRLAELNNLRREVMTDRTSFLAMDVFNATLKEWSIWRESITNRLTVIETRSVTWTAALGIFFIIIQVVIFWLTHK